MSNIESALEAVLFASGDSMSVSRLASVIDCSEYEIREAAESLSKKYIRDGSGIRLLSLEDSFQLCTAPDYSEYVMKALEDTRPAALSQPALEVLSVVAYFQPVTKVYIDQVRGVDSTYTVNMLCNRGLIEQCGRLDVPGRPLLYKTTEEFLRTSGLSSVDDLPVLPDLTSSEGTEELRLRIEELRSSPIPEQISLTDINQESLTER